MFGDRHNAVQDATTLPDGEEDSHDVEPSRAEVQEASQDEVLLRVVFMRRGEWAFLVGL